jgi:hypothetical protein
LEDAAYAAHRQGGRYAHPAHHQHQHRPPRAGDRANRCRHHPGADGLLLGSGPGACRVARAEPPVKLPPRLSWAPREDLFSHGGSSPPKAGPQPAG